MVRSPSDRSNTAACSCEDVVSQPEEVYISVVHLSICRVGREVLVVFTGRESDKEGLP